MLSGTSSATSLNLDTNRLFTSRTDSRALKATVTSMVTPQPAYTRRTWQGRFTLAFLHNFYFLYSCMFSGFNSHWITPLIHFQPSACVFHCQLHVPSKRQNATLKYRWFKISCSLKSNQAAEGNLIQNISFSAGALNSPFGRQTWRSNIPHSFHLIIFYTGQRLKPRLSVGDFLVCHMKFQNMVHLSVRSNFLIASQGHPYRRGKRHAVAWPCGCSRGTRTPSCVGLSSNVWLPE